MIAADSSTVIAFIQGDPGEDVEYFLRHLYEDKVFLPPVVVSEVLSDHTLSEDTIQRIGLIRVLTLTDGYWERAGQTRSKLLKRRLRARMPDVLIAQSCIDHDVPLLTRDRDFKNFSRYAGLKLVLKKI